MLLSERVLEQKRLVRNIRMFLIANSDNESHAEVNRTLQLDDKDNNENSGTKYV